MFGICHLGVIPCRFEPSDKSEMVTQLLFGETFEIIKQEGKWLQIRITLDGYECWIDEKQFLPLSEELYTKQSSFPATCSADLVDLVPKTRILRWQASSFAPRGTLRGNRRSPPWGLTG